MKLALWWPAVLMLAVYAFALPAAFQFDDWQVVLHDPRVASLAAWADSMPGMRALVKLSYALNHEWSGRVEWFRATNLLLHAANAVLVFLLTRRLARGLRIADDSGPTVVAVVSALVFALHPVQTESVTYIAGRPNLLVTMCCLLAVLAWLRSLAPAATRWWSAVAAVLFVAALASKETAAVLPLAMALCLAIETRLEPRRPWMLPVLLLALCVALFLLAWSWLPYDYLLRTSLQTRAPLDNLAVQVEGVSWLIGQLWRWDLLNADPMLQVSGDLSLRASFHGLLLLAVIGFALTNIRRRPVLAFGVLWFFVWLAPTNSLLARLDVANDRQLYCAIIGPAWLLGHGIARLNKGAWAAVLVLAVLLGWGTAYRNRVYATEVTFWSDVTLKSPHNARAWNNLGIAEAMACNAEAAGRAFAEASSRDPDFMLPQINLALLQEGELPDVPKTCRQPTS